MALAQYGTLITTIGLAQIANAQITQTKVGLEYIALGDGNGAHYVPTQNQTALVHEVWRGPIAELSIDPTNSNRIIIDAVIPVTAGGFTIREIGIFDDKNNLIAVGQYPEKYKPQLSEGVSEETLIHFVIETNNADVVKLTIDPTVIIASRNYVDGKVAQVQKALTEHSGQIATTEKLGHIKPDGETITVDPETGIASAQEQGYQLTDGEYVIDYSTGHADDLVKSGFYKVTGGALTGRGFPLNLGAAIATVEVYTADDGTVLQKFTFSSLVRGYSYVRGRHGGVWSPWDRAVTINDVNVDYKTYYVDGTLGTDDPNFGLGTGAKAFKTINYALSRLTKFNTKEVTINVANGVYNENVNIDGFIGANIRLIGTSSGTILNNLYVSNCGRFAGQNFQVKTTIDIRAVNQFSLFACGKTDASTSDGLYVLASIGMVSAGAFSNCTGSAAGIRVGNNSVIYIEAIAGSGNAVGIHCSGSIVRKNGSTITGTTAQTVTGGGQII
ncbi:phage tail protein [Lysinibacillus fusiformis]|uniref:phage tail-collar fiber domain-containing protein n=1 Tax=Lysinibacillus fusiformis TaxID=28031 RepID=UPI003AAB7AD6